VHWAHRVTDQFPDGQLYADLRGFDACGQGVDPAEAMPGFLTALGVPPPQIPAGLDAQAAMFRSVVAGKRLLVVLDNARDADQVRPGRPGAAAAATVVTSRNQLTSLVVAFGAQPLNLDLLCAAGSRDLLARRLGDARVAGEPEAVAAIVDACSGLPLAL